MEADYKIGGAWGNAINWMNPDDFSKSIETEKDRFSVVGWKRNRPKVGNTLVGEFEKSFIFFEFTKVDYQSNPPDMFFGEVKAIKQEMKESK